MKDEIKEIFDIKELFEEWKQFLSWCYETNDKTVEIHRDKLKWTMDYITDLQDRIKELEAINEEHRKINGELREENKKLQNIIDKSIKYASETGDLLDCYHNREWRDMEAILYGNEIEDDD